LTNLSEMKPNDSTESPNQTRNAAIRRIFIGEHGIRAGWSVLLFLVIFMALEKVVTLALTHFISFDPTKPIPLDLGLLQESAALLVVFLATWIMARIERRPLLSYGYTGEHRAIRFISGVVCGILCMSLLIGILWKSGLLVFDGRLLSGLTAWKYALGWALGFLVVGLVEESLLRGYLQHTLTRGIGFWWAALVLSIAFAMGHIGNNGESPLGILQVGLGGLFFCLSLWFTRSLWWAVGFHAGWDWSQSYLYGTPDSGLRMNGHLLASHPSGNPLWSGGSPGPEGSLLVTPLLILTATVMWLWWGRKTTGVRGRGWD
jgi:uncharacterized protein